jgi:NifU-like protein involved in Fe-S cluster formation
MQAELNTGKNSVMQTLNWRNYNKITKIYFHRSACQLGMMSASLSIHLMLMS